MPLTDLLRRFRPAQVIGHLRIAHQSLKKRKVARRPRAQGDIGRLCSGHGSPAGHHKHRDCMILAHGPGESERATIAHSTRGELGMSMGRLGFFVVMGKIGAESFKKAKR